MLLKLTPVLGSLLLSNGNTLVGDRNSTRWIVDILQSPGADMNVLSSELRARFQLVHGVKPQRAQLYSFMFCPHDPGMYQARPSLTYEPEERMFALLAEPVEAPTSYRLAIDILHSMHR